jgi:hypothetical protein
LLGVRVMVFNVIFNNISAFNIWRLNITNIMINIYLLEDHIILGSVQIRRWWACPLRTGLCIMCNTSYILNENSSKLWMFANYNNMKIFEFDHMAIGRLCIRMRTSFLSGENWHWKNKSFNQSIFEGFFFGL